MKLKLIANLILTAAVLLIPLASSALDQRPLCQVCRRYIDTSPQACSAFILLGGRHPKSIQACSLFCLFEQLEQYESEPETIMIVNYETLEDEFVQQLNTKQAAYLFGVDAVEDELCNEPAVFAFPTKDAAKQAQAELGGELLEWAEVEARCVKLAAMWEPGTTNDEPSSIPHRRHR